MRYDHEGNPREEAIKRVAFEEGVIRKNVQYIRQLAALLTGFSAFFRDKLIFEYAHALVAYELQDNVRNFMPGYHYVEHAADWMHQALSQPPLEVEYFIDDDDFLTSLRYKDQPTTPEHELQAMKHLYHLLEHLEEAYRWQILYAYAKNKYARKAIFYDAGEMMEAAEIVARFRVWMSQESRA
jgi:hypothetical protein